MPIYEEFLAGGPRSFVGFERDELRGDNIAILGLAYRLRLFDLPIPLGKGVYGKAMYNVGNVWGSYSDIADDPNLRHGGGLGLALDTVIGPFEIDVGFGSGGRSQLYLDFGFPLSTTNRSVQ